MCVKRWRKTLSIVQDGFGPHMRDELLRMYVNAPSKNCYSPLRPYCPASLQHAFTWALDLIEDGNGKEEIIFQCSAIGWAFRNSSFVASQPQAVACMSKGHNAIWMQRQARCRTQNCAIPSEDCVFVRWRQHGTAKIHALL